MARPQKGKREVTVQMPKAILRLLKREAKARTKAGALRRACSRSALVVEAVRSHYAPVMAEEKTA
jgi:hypothetical protein